MPIGYYRMSNLRSVSLVITVSAILVPDLPWTAILGQDCPWAAARARIIPPIILVMVVITLLDIVRLGVKHDDRRQWRSYQNLKPGARVMPVSAIPVPDLAGTAILGQDRPRSAARA
jgi:hypothetical protein